MKTLILTLFAGLALALSGCIAPMGREYAKLIQEVPAAEITDISTITTSPLWGFQASASGITTDPATGMMVVTNGKAQFTIPLWGFAKTLNISGLKVQATPAQLAAASALQQAKAAGAIPK